MVLVPKQIDTPMELKIEASEITPHNFSNWKRIPYLNGVGKTG